MDLCDTHELGLDTVDSVDGESLPKLSLWVNINEKSLVSLILAFVGCPDTLALLRTLCRPEHNPFYPDKEAWKSVALQIYKKVNNLSRWNNSYEYLLANRPRIRLNGFFYQRMSYLKRPCNDRFWEEYEANEDIEITFFRHMRFFRDGRVLYSLNNDPPDEVAKTFTRGPIAKKVYEGSYRLEKGGEVVVVVDVDYAVIRFKMLILKIT